MYEKKRLKLLYSTNFKSGYLIEEEKCDRC